MAKGERSKPAKAEKDGEAAPEGSAKKRTRAGTALRILRDASGLIQKELAARTEEVSERKVGVYERGDGTFDAEDVGKLLAGLNLPYEAWAETMEYLDRLDWHWRRRRGESPVSGRGGAADLITDRAPKDDSEALREIERIAKAAGRAEEQKTYDTLRTLLLRAKRE